jgi:hypothetical protein
MTPIRSALKIGSPRSKGYRSTGPDGYLSRQPCRVRQPGYRAAEGRYFGFAESGHRGNQLMTACAQ